MHVVPKHLIYQYRILKLNKLGIEIERIKIMERKAEHYFSSDRNISEIFQEITISTSAD